MERIKKKSKTVRIMIGLVFVFLLLIICGLYNPLSVSQIALSPDSIRHTIKIALISDLHSCRYGNDQTELIEAIDKQKPDVICFAGDIFDDTLPDDNTEKLLAGISGRYPCYYVTGNHECRSDANAFRKKMETLEKYDVIRLSNESREIELNGQKITICGVDDPSFDQHDNEADFHDVLNRIQNELHDNSFSVLLSHRPEYFSFYAECGYDLVLCGHAHGGQWRIPWLLSNGLIAPNQGLFPKYTNGKYVSGDSTMIVSRGLAKESTSVPRFYNRPEIVIIELQ